MDLKPLPSSLRKRRRYIVVDIISDEEISLGGAVKIIWDTTLNFLGEVETSKAGVWVVKDLFDKKNQRCAVKVNHNYVEEMRASLSLISELNGERATFQVLGVTGTMKSARAKYYD